MIPTADFLMLVASLLNPTDPLTLASIMTAGALNESPVRDANNQIIGVDPANRTGDGGHSYGAYQINDVNRVDDAIRLDPARATQWMLPRYRDAYQKGLALGLSGDRLAVYSYMVAEMPLGFRSPAAGLWGENSAAAQGYLDKLGIVQQHGQGLAPAPPDVQDDPDPPPALWDACEERQGIPYRIDPPPDGSNNLDCSLFTRQVLMQAGVDVGSARTAEQQRGYLLTHGGTLIAQDSIGWENVRPGDVLFCEHTYEPDEQPSYPDGCVATHILIRGPVRGYAWHCYASNGDSGPPGVTYMNIIDVAWIQNSLFMAVRPRWPGAKTQKTPPGTMSDAEWGAAIVTEIHRWRTDLEAAKAGYNWNAVQAVIDTLRQNEG